MKSIKNFSPAFMLAVILIVGLQSIFANTITGTVYDSRKNPLADVDVELLDDLSRAQSRTKTDGNGRYEFSGISDGRFTIRVQPFRYDYVQQEQQVELVSVSAISSGARAEGAASGGSATTIQDFFLVAKKGSIAEVEASVVFAQEVPKEAKAAYEKALKALAKKQFEPGMEDLKLAIKIFPNYFLALQQLGKEYFIKGNFAEAAPFLVRAADVNNKSPLSFYTLGYCLHKLGYNKAAIVSLKQAANLSPASASIFFALGTAERLENQFADAETHLKQAKKLAQGVFPDLHWQLALLYGENLKKYSEAADEFEQFLIERPNAQDAEKIKNIIKSYREKSKQQN
ncbi:MAG: carboxypeptidase regulatory-like domain-containing protein [Pyrinomonadaceae bacterium]